MREPPGDVAGGGGGVPLCGRNEGADASMWMDWSQSVQDEDMAGGEQDSDSGSMGS